jgi:methenyltetrahydromethanopterin cyclohydrolase
MTLSLNDRARELADRLAADADALRVAVDTRSDGTRVIDCGSAVPGGLEAGRRFASARSRSRRSCSTAAGSPG